MTGAETPCQKWGGGSVFMKFTIYIQSEILHSSFDPLTTKFGGAQPPLSKSGGLKSPAPPGSLPLHECNLLLHYILLQKYSTVGLCT